MSAPLRVLVVDAHPVFRRGLRDLLAAPGSGIDLVGEAATAIAARQLLRRTAADVVVLGESLPDGAGFDVVRALSEGWPNVRTVVLASTAGADAVFRAFAAGAAGYLLRTVAEAELLDAIRMVAAGGQVLDPGLTGAMVTWLGERRERAAAGRASSTRDLTERQEHILSLIGQGLSNRQIGERLGIAEKTVKNHVTELLRRLGLSSRTEAALFVSRRLASQPAAS